MKVKVEILESGFCPKCATVKEKVLKVSEELGAEVSLLDPVEDTDRIVELGILTSPAVVVNGKVKFVGVIPTEEKIRQAILEEMT